MKTGRLRNSTLLLISVLLVLSSGCAGKIRYTVNGQVVDGDTGKSVEGAVVAVRWLGYSRCLIGFEGSVGIEYGDAEDVSDADGRFEIPAYRSTPYYMCVYKKGYVCWMNDKVFPGWGWRRGFRLKDGVVIRLEPFRESYSKEEHARFTVLGAGYCVGIEGSGLKFYKAIEEEEHLLNQTIKEKKGEKGKKK